MRKGMVQYNMKTLFLLLLVSGVSFAARTPQEIERDKAIRQLQANAYANGFLDGKALFQREFKTEGDKDYCAVDIVHDKFDCRFETREACLKENNLLCAETINSRVSKLNPKKILEEVEEELKQEKTK